MSGKVIHGFHDSLKNTLLAARLLGLFPVTGLLKQSSKHSRCTWLHPYTVYYMVTVTSIISCALLHLYDAINSTREFTDYGLLLLQCFTSMDVIIMLVLASNWRCMMTEIDKIERLLPPLKNGRMVVRNINRIMAFILLFGFARYVGHMVFACFVLYKCIEGVEGSLAFQDYFRSYFDWYFMIFPFNYFTAIYLEIINFVTRFMFYYTDGLVIAVALYLIFRFRNFNRLMGIKMQKCNQNTKWSDIQAHFTRLTKLVKIIDDNMNPFVFQSFLCNLVFICKMVYDFIQYQKNVTEYNNSGDCLIVTRSNFFSVFNTLITVTFRFTRALSVSMLCSHVHALSRRPLDALHTLPASGYNWELQRFLDQVYHSKISLSGLQFFFVTRRMFLSLVSTIITYELVLLQLPVLYLNGVYAM